MASYSDDFDRANGEIGANWIEDAGDIDIVSNVAETQTDGAWNRARYASALDSNDHYVQADMAGRSTSNHGNITARQASSTQTDYDCGFVEAYDTRLRKHFSGETNLDTWVGPPDNNQHTFKLIVDGASQSLEVDGTERCSGTDSDVTTGAYAGISVWDMEGGRWDNWSAADLAAGGGFQPAWARNSNVILQAANL